MELYKVMQVSCKDVENVLKNSPSGRHTDFLRAAHSLWIRFKNYEKARPYALVQDNQIKSLIFSTFNRDGYANLYEVVTVEGQGGYGYGHMLWETWIQIAHDAGCRRLKLSCTPESIGWHYSHGLIFWGVDKSGSLRSDQPLFPTVEKQLRYRENAIRCPRDHLPPLKQREKFKKEISELQFGKRKQAKVQTAICTVCNAWLTPHLYTQEDK